MDRWNEEEEEEEEEDRQAKLHIEGARNEVSSCPLYPNEKYMETCLKNESFVANLARDLKKKKGSVHFEQKTNGPMQTVYTCICVDKTLQIYN